LNRFDVFGADLDGMPSDKSFFQRDFVGFHDQHDAKAPKGHVRGGAKNQYQKDAPYRACRKACFYRKKYRPREKNHYRPYVPIEAPPRRSVSLLRKFLFVHIFFRHIFFLLVLLIQAARHT
jgi:hypothetical protein